MTWAQHDGLWAIGDPVDDPPPLLQAVEARGVLLEWPIDAPEGRAPFLTVTDTFEAEWLWQLIGERAHAALLTMSAGGERKEVEPKWSAPLLGHLRKFAHGMWLRSWWPASIRDGLPPLDRQVLDGELVELADQLEGILDEEVAAEFSRSWLAIATTRADFALAAAGESQAVPETVIASGTAPVPWQGVPAGIVDATEEAAHWSVDATPDPVLHVVVRPLGSAHLLSGLAGAAELPGVPVAEGALDSHGAVLLPLSMSAREAWAADWTRLVLTVGVDVAETAKLRTDVRSFARSRRGAADFRSFAAEADDDF